MNQIAGDECIAASMRIERAREQRWMRIERKVEQIIQKLDLVASVAAQAATDATVERLAQAYCTPCG